MSKKMKNKFWAKTNPMETIMEHTEALLQEYQRFMKIYPDFVKKIPRVWKLLLWGCIYHDLGKVNNKFQDKMLTGKKQRGGIATCHIKYCLFKCRRIGKRIFYGGNRGFICCDFVSS